MINKPNAPDAAAYPLNFSGRNKGVVQFSHDRINAEYKLAANSKYLAFRTLLN